MENHESGDGRAGEGGCKVVTTYQLYNLPTGLLIAESRMQRTVLTPDMCSRDWVLVRKSGGRVAACRVPTGETLPPAASRRVLARLAAMRERNGLE